MGSGEEVVGSCGQWRERVGGAAKHLLRAWQAKATRGEVEKPLISKGTGQGESISKAVCKMSVKCFSRPAYLHDRVRKG